MRQWSLQDAEARQEITLHSDSTMVVLSITEYRHSRQPNTGATNPNGAVIGAL